MVAVSLYQKTKSQIAVSATGERISTDSQRSEFGRSAVRNLDRSGVPPKIATAITGHKTRSVYERYNIVADRDLSDAAQKMDRYLEQKREQAERTVSGPTH